MAKHRKYVVDDVVEHAGQTVKIRKAGVNMFEGVTLFDDVWEQQHPVMGWWENIDSLVRASETI